MNRHYIKTALKSTLPRRQKFLLLTLACLAGPDGTVKETVTSLAKICGASRGTIRTILTELEEGGYVIFSRSGIQILPRRNTDEQGKQDTIC